MVTCIHFCLCDLAAILLGVPSRLLPKMGKLKKRFRSDTGQILAESASPTSTLANENAPKPFKLRRVKSHQDVTNDLTEIRWLPQLSPGESCQPEYSTAE